MSRRPWMPLYTGDLTADTMHLGPTEFGIYMRLMVHCWQHGSFPEDKIRIIAKCSSKLLHKYKSEILKFFIPTGDPKVGSYWCHNRVNFERTRCEEISNKRKAAALQKHTHSHSHSHSHKERKEEQPAPKTQKHRRQTQPIPPDWQVPEDAIELANKKGVDWREVEQKLRDYVASTGTQYVNYDATIRNWIRRENGVQGNGQGRPRPLQDDSKSASRAAARLQEAAERGEFTFGPRPSLLPKEGKATVLVLPKGRGT